MRCGDSRSAEKAALERREVAGGTCSAARAPSMRRAPSGVLLVSAAVRPQRQSAPTANRRFRFCSNSSSPAGSSNCRRAARDRAPGCENPRRRALGAGPRGACGWAQGCGVRGAWGRAPGAGRGTLVAGLRAVGRRAAGLRALGAERRARSIGSRGVGRKALGRRVSALSFCSSEMQEKFPQVVKIRISRGFSRRQTSR